MTRSVQKIQLSASRDIPFNKLVLSQANVRRIKAGVSLEELAEDIARRTLLQSITVRPVLDEGGAETGMFEIPAGGRRYRALELLVKQKRLPRNAPIPCVVRLEGTAEEDSLAENVQRAPLHPLDQFRAFLTLREKGQSEEEIAATFFVSVAVVKQRLRLASVSPALLEVYAEDGMTLDQLMAFTVNPDHERQEQVWEAIQRSYNKEAYQIRRLLTEGAVRASDKRAQYVGEDYLAAGGPIMRDLFQSDDGGWLQDVPLLERLVAEKLARDAQPIRAEGWKWVETAIDFPYGHTYGLRHIQGERQPLSEEEAATRESLRLEAEQLEAAYSDADEIPEDIDARLAEIETALEAMEDRPVIYAPEDIARGGVFVSIDGSGQLRIERGYVRPEDEAPIEGPEALTGESETEDVGGAHLSAAALAQGAAPDRDDMVRSGVTDDEEDEGLRPLPDKLLTELTAYRTLALREALGNDPDMAFLAALHAICLRLFYRYGSDTCLEMEAKTVSFGVQAPGLSDTPLAAKVDARNLDWSQQLPAEPQDLWDVLTTFDVEARQRLFAHCISLTVNAVHEPWSRRPRAIAHADRLAASLSLDIAATSWRPTADNFLGRVTKARIVQAVSQAKGADIARRIEGLKKSDMVQEAERLLSGANWLPEPLRTPGCARHSHASEGTVPEQTVEEDAIPVEESAAIESEAAIDETASEDDADEASVDEPQGVAAE
ncbi:ParB/RepB/Spo0J family partition protein [Methylocystis parvus]|uniref:DNA-binding protein n=1 Tax=Methylocystis parvus TaxID=134 RepID=A0A6B8M966_9HYPH|nr:ParB/RepB/Spo0J family partition protein [Methylocystis parvus]QGM97260.1 DNA-binding protein [Methylocystis parvus]WBJ98828.1 ParB/RepB/Spo0J family partition protein [Methylocystis parvus OBBP]